jgi:hypothetical protein
MEGSPIGLVGEEVRGRRRYNSSERGCFLLRNEAREYSIDKLTYYIV